MNENLSPDVLNRITRLEQLVKQLKAEDKKLRKSITSGGSGGSTGDFANGIGALNSDPTKVGLVTSDLIETAIINLNGNDFRFTLESGSEFGLYGDPLGTSALFFTPNDFYLEMRHPLIDDAGYVYFDVGYGGGGQPWLDIYVEGGPGSNTDLEIYIEPGLLGFYFNSDNIVWEIYDLPLEEDAPNVMCLNGDGRVVMRTVSGLSGGGGGFAVTTDSSNNTGTSTGYVLMPSFVVPLTEIGKEHEIEISLSVTVADDVGAVWFTWFMGGGGALGNGRVFWRALANSSVAPAQSMMGRFGITQAIQSEFIPTGILDGGFTEGVVECKLHIRPTVAGTCTLRLAHAVRNFGNAAILPGSWWKSTVLN